ncbi:unnamed protein product [Pleuronectes platessa]|uniref:Uncharacterized protein n=1 Tax=Pleuronectes platessa TaxID=8262 RepID=A0A9N7THC8_PLEPL|nr:unnamed protein product [Pleuronectes platessa]
MGFVRLPVMQGLQQSGIKSSALTPAYESEVRMPTAKDHHGVTETNVAPSRRPALSFNAPGGEELWDTVCPQQRLSQASWMFPFRHVVLVNLCSLVEEGF